MVTLSKMYKIQPVAFMQETEETLQQVAAKSLILKVWPPKIHISVVFFRCTHRFASARHRTPSWSPHIARTSQWQRVANASGLLASAHFSARLRSSAGTPGVAGWRFSSTARDRKRQEETKRDRDDGGLKDDGMDGDEVERIISEAQSGDENGEREGERREERQNRKSSSPLSCFTEKI